MSPSAGFIAGELAPGPDDHDERRGAYRSPGTTKQACGHRGGTSRRAALCPRPARSLRQPGRFVSGGAFTTRWHPATSGRRAGPWRGGGWLDKDEVVQKKPDDGCSARIRELGSRGSAARSSLSLQAANRKSHGAAFPLLVHFRGPSWNDRRKKRATGKGIRETWKLTLTVSLPIKFHHQ